MRSSRWISVAVLAATTATAHAQDATYTHVEVTGLRSTRHDVILDLLPRPLPARLSAPEVRELQRRIKNLGIFDMNDLRELFAEVLAAKLGRTAAEIRGEGLRAGDFKPDESIELTLSDGSTMSFRYAFCVFELRQRMVGVFTEH